MLTLAVSLVVVPTTSSLMAGGMRAAPLHLRTGGHPSMGFFDGLAAAFENDDTLIVFCDFSKK